jgi:hypothetical protein
VSPVLSLPVPARYAVLAFVPDSLNAQPEGTTVLVVPAFASVSKFWVYAEAIVVRLTPTAPAVVAVEAVNAQLMRKRVRRFTIILPIVLGSRRVRRV